MNSYEQDCLKSSSVIKPLFGAMLDDLDSDAGGFRSWAGHTDQRRVILISDYLLATVRQLSADVTGSALHRKVIREKWYAESQWIRQRVRQYPDAHPDVILSRGDVDLERLIHIENATKGFFAGVGGALDALGAIFVGIAAINVPITDAAWSAAAKSSRWLGQKTCKALEPAGTSGRAVQETCIRALSKALPGSPVNWLEWTLDMRNALVHRGTRMSPTQLDRNKRTGIQAALLLPSEPKFSDAEAFARNDAIEGVYLREHIEVTVNGVFENLQDLVVGFLSILTGLWSSRVMDPTLIVSGTRRFCGFQRGQPTFWRLIRFAPVDISVLWTSSNASPVAAMPEDDVWWITVSTPLPQWWVPMSTGLVALLVTVAAVLPRATWTRRTAFAFNVVGTIAHEFGHAVGGVVTGGGVYLIQVHSPHSGVTHTWYYSRLSNFVITFSGYALPLLAGLGAASLLARGHAPMLLAFTIAAMVLILFVTRDLITFVSVVTVGLAAALALYWGAEWVQHWIAYTETWLLLFSQITGVWFLVARRVWGHDGSSVDDADALADITVVPSVVWIAAWSGLIGWVLWNAVPLLWP